MKKKIKMILTLWLGVICNVVFSNEHAINNCKTVSECLQSAVEMDNKLVQENLELKKEIKGLKKNIEWVDVPLTDTQPFDEDCEYRAKIKFSGRWAMTYVVEQNRKGNIVLYASGVHPEELFFILSTNTPYNESTSTGIYAHYTNIHYDNKKISPRMENGEVLKIEKRCTAVK